MWLQWFNLNVTKRREYFLCTKKQNNDFIQQYLVMGDFKTLLHEALKLYKSFVSNQWFRACIKLPKSRSSVVNHCNFWNTYDVTKPRLLKSCDSGSFESLIRNKRFRKLRSHWKRIILEVAATTWHIVWEKIPGILPFPRATAFTHAGTHTHTHTHIYIYIYIYIYK